MLKLLDTRLLLNHRWALISKGSLPVKDIVLGRKIKVRENLEVLVRQAGSFENGASVKTNPWIYALCSNQDDQRVKRMNEIQRKLLLSTRGCVLRFKGITKL